MFKLIAIGASSLLGLGLSALLPPPGPDGPPPRPPEKKKGKAAEDLRKAYDALQRLQVDDGRGGRAGDRLRDWAERAAGFYRKGIRAKQNGDERLAHEYGAIAHDLARAANHAASADRFDRRDDLPPPPDDAPEKGRDRTRRDLRRAYDRIREVEAGDLTREARFYVDAARDLYRAARRDAEDGRDERAGELARAAEAMSHVPEHLAHIDRGPDGPPPPEPKKDRRPGPPGDRRDDLPPPLMP